jgi:hypothetical protein
VSRRKQIEFSEQLPGTPSIRPVISNTLASVGLLPISNFELLIYNVFVILSTSAFVIVEFGRVGLARVICEAGTRSWRILNEKLKFCYHH